MAAMGRGLGLTFLCLLFGCNESDREPDVTWDVPSEAEDGDGGTETLDDAVGEEEGPAEIADALEDAGSDGEASDTEGATYDGLVADFVLASLRLGDQMLGEGFNLDGLDTPPGHPYLPEDGPDGVDNQFGSAVDAFIRAGLDVAVNEELATAIAEGRLLMLLRHRDVDDWSADPDGVPLYAYVGHDADADFSNNLTGAAEMLVSERSLVDSGDIWSTASVFPDGTLLDTSAADASLQEGDFESGAGRLDLLVAFGADQLLELPIEGAQLVWDLDSAPTGDPPLGGRVINGLLGGHVLLRDAVRAFALLDFSGTTIDEATIRTILAGQADMDVIPEGFTDDPCTEATMPADCSPGQTCEVDSARAGAFFCYEMASQPDALSVGFVFTAVSCRITGVWDDPSWP